MSDRFDIKERVAIVTGASGGLGEQFARTLAREGARVALAARRLEELERVANHIAADGGEALPVVLDVSDPESIDRGIDQTQSALGPIAILVNNSGVVIHKPLLAHTVEDWEAVVNVNLRGAYLMAKAVAKQMVDTDTHGSIINIASIIGVSRNAMQIPEYLASKGGLVSLTKGMAAELARHHIRVNALAPGYIETDFNRDFLATDAGQRLIRGIPQRRAGTPDELDGALLLLASDASTFMTGSVLTVDGGHSVTSV
ncbi:MAG: glucose 1-dehydrogenase [Pseudomonadota bacterium]